MTDLQTEKLNRISLATRQQQQAANPTTSVWVEASAGTGKTKVLSDRVLRILLNGTPPSKILCLTYTKAAAVEMNNRISNRLSRWTVANDQDLSSDLQKLFNSKNIPSETFTQARRLFALVLDTPGGMKIQTIHSFCQEILKRFPLEAKISPYFEVMDDRTAKEALENIKTSLFQKIESAPDSKTAKALNYITTKLSENTFPKLMNSITNNRNKIIRILNNYSSSDEFIKTLAQRLKISPNTTCLDILQDFWQKTDTETINKFAEAMQIGSDKDKSKSLMLLSSVKKQNYNDYRKIFLTDKNEPRKSPATKKVLSIFPEAEGFAYNEAMRLLATDNKIAASELLASTSAVLYLAQDLLNCYTEFKQLHSKMDYEDLIIQTEQLLNNPLVADWVLYKLDGGIDHVLIDEAQDTSPTQWSIIKSVTNELFYGNSSKSKKGSVFAVGDRKQSIYSFQGADPQEFENSKQHFASKSSSSSPFEEINLDVSFRSTSAIMDVVNQVFLSPEAKQGVVLPEQTVCHIPSRIGEGGRVEIWPLIEAKKDENPNIWLPPVERIKAESTSSRLANLIAETIYRQVSGKEILTSQNRPICYRDYMILVQRRNSFVEELVRACKNLGVNIAGADKITLSEQIAVQDLISIAKFALLPEDDLSLAEALKSPIFALTDDDLLKLCYNRGQTSLWQRLKQSSSYHNTVQDLQSILNLTDNLRPFEFFNYILTILKGRQKFISRLGHEADDGLDEFINLTLAFEKEHIPSLQLFIEWIEQDDIEIKRELEQNQADAVRIMTVHGSKGLQAPIVILPDTVRVKAIRNEAEILMDKDLFLYPFSSSEYEDYCKQIKSEQKRLSLEEYHRLLYVALTRAEERLYICGYQKGSISADSWYQLCKNALSGIMTQDSDKDVYEIKQEIPLPEIKHDSLKNDKPILFSWLNTPAKEESPLAKPLAPSKADDEEDLMSSPLTDNHPEYFKRGIIIHKLLQILPDIPSEKRISTAEQYLKTQYSEIPAGEQQKIISEIIYLLNHSHFAYLFCSTSKAEVPIMGEVNGKIISGQIDRLVILPDQIAIIDYKTNRPAAKTLTDVPLSYYKQLRAYKALIAKIYPDKEIKTYILWTNTAHLMEIE